MYNLTSDELLAMGAEITTREIKQQPELWQEALETYLSKEVDVTTYLNAIQTQHDFVKVIFTGAGTSAYVGDIITPYLNQVNDQRRRMFHAHATTDIVSNPRAYFQENIPTLLVSFARSGNSPESVAAVNLGKQLVKDFYQLTITCAPEGALAKAAVGDDKNIVILQPAKANDQGFAMTGSFTCMTLTALLTFDTTNTDNKVSFVKSAIRMSNSVYTREAEIQSMLDSDFNRVIYLGSGGFVGLAREAQLKILELTAGKVTTAFDSSMGFRHGPKSFVNEKSLVFVFVSNDAYTRSYDLDIISELTADQIASLVLPIQVEQAEQMAEKGFNFTESMTLVPDAYLVLPYIVFGQTIALLSAIKTGNQPDTPSPTGTVNRVVKGVTIHALNS